MDQTVTLTDTEWTQVLNVLANSQGFAWAITNPLLMKIGGQLQGQAEFSSQPPAHAPGVIVRGDGVDPDQPPRRRPARGE